MDIKSDLTWLQRHERLVALFMTIVMLLCLGNWYINHSADVAVAKAAAATQVAQEDAANNAKLAAQAQADAARYEDLLKATQDQNTKLSALLAQRSVVLQQQQQKDKTAPIPDVLKRWGQLVPLEPSDLSADSSGVKITENGARETVSALEEIPVLKQNNADLQADITREVNLNGSANEVITSQTNQIVGLNKQLTDDAKQCRLDIDAAKAVARKSKRNWFLRGVGTGAAVALYLAAHFGAL